MLSYRLMALPSALQPFAHSVTSHRMPLATTHLLARIIIHGPAAMILCEISFLTFAKWAAFTRKRNRPSLPNSATIRLELFGIPTLVVMFFFSLAPAHALLTLQ